MHEQQDAYSDRVIARVDAVAPGFRDSVILRQVLGP
jgi:phytoene dehydrogenase-like protein